MAVAEQRKTYYDEIDRQQSWIDNHLPIKVCLHNYLAQAFFGGDSSRVIYTNEKYAFRKRIETLAEGFDTSEGFNVHTLDLPFANFSQSKDVELLKTSASSQYLGQYVKSIGMYLRFLGSKRHYRATVYYNSQEDMRKAIQIANWEKALGTQALYKCSYLWRGKSLNVPCFITLMSFTSSNAAYKQEDFLNKSSIYALTLELEIETAETLMNKGLNGVLLPVKFYDHGDDWCIDNPTKVYYTQKTTIAFMAQHWGMTFNSEDVDVDTNEEQAAVYSALREPTAKEQKQIDKAIEAITSTPNEYASEILAAYFSETSALQLNKLRYNEKKTVVDEMTGKVTAAIDLVVKPSTYQYFDHIDISIPSHEQITLTDCHMTSFTIDNLYPNSTYRIFAILHSISGEMSEVELEFTTPKWVHEVVPDVLETDSLVSRPSTIAQTTESTAEKPNVDEKPKRIQINGMVGLNL